MVYSCGMSNPPKPDYEIIERDGLLVVERQDAPKKRKLHLPRLAIPRISFSKFGTNLFRRQEYLDFDEAGNAIIYATTLKTLLNLDARDGDRYYITERQQAILGYVLNAPWFLIGPAVLVPFIVGQLDWMWILALALAAMIGAAFVYPMWQEVEDIHGQRYEPEERAEPAPGPPVNAPAP